MNWWKELIVPFVIATLITMGLRHYFWGKPSVDTAASVAQSGQVFVAPQSMQEVKPLQLEVDFLADDEHRQEQITIIETEYASFEFSTFGAVIKNLSFKKNNNDSTTRITTIEPAAWRERHEGAFLVATQDATPYYYRLLSQEELPDSWRISYQVVSPLVSITKTFSVEKRDHKISLEVHIIPSAGHSVQPRVLFPSPYIRGLTGDTQVSALVNTTSGSLQKISRKSLNTRQGWIAPTLFGSEDKYFIHSLIADSEKFVQRGYFKPQCNDLITILEGISVDKESSWKLDFYLGPKSEQAIAAVDSRLEKAIEYSGILAPLARVLLALLIWINGFVNNYGFAIILLTLLIKLVLLPFSLTSAKDTAKRAEYQKKLAYIQQRYKDDPEALNRERAELVRKHGMPGLGSCIPHLVQLPLFFALQRVLSSSIELYKAPFILWIKDLSMPDPYYVLPVFVTLTMFMQAALADKSQRLSLLAVGLVLGAVTSSLSAGLALYLVTNAIIHTAQNYLTAGKAH